MQNIFKKIPVFAVLAAIQFFGCSINSTTDYFYKVTFRSAEGGMVCDAGDHICQFNDTLFLRLCSVEKGYRFKEWMVDTKAGILVLSDKYNDTAVITQIKGSCTIVPEFTRDSYQLHQVNDTLGVVSKYKISDLPAGEKTKIPTITLPYDTSKWGLSHWVITNGKGEISNDSIILYSDCVIEPVFINKTYTFTVVQPSEGGTIASTPASGNFCASGTVVSLTVTPFFGWKVKSWSGGNIVPKDETHATATLIRTTAYSVEFQRESYSLTITALSNGKIRDSLGNSMSGTYTFPFDYVVKLNASADTGYQFSSWNGATGSVSTTLTMDGNKTIGASFIEIPGKSGVIYVWSGLATGSHTGTNWANAYSDLNTAVSAAAADAVIWAKCGEYSPNSTLTLAAHVKMYGGFSGFEGASHDINGRPFYKNFSILSGSSANIIMKLSNGCDTIGGFIFTGAATNAIYIESSSNCIEDCVIKNTGSTSASNAVKLLPQISSTMIGNVIQRTVFHSNTGTNVNAGKAINIASGVFGTKILNSVFYKNGGPAINNGNTTTDDASGTSIIACTIVDNGSTSWAAPGGIRSSSGIMFLQGSILWHNKSDGTKATQIDVADWVEDCDIQDHSTTGVTMKKRWQDDNLEIDPVLNSMTILTDGAWFAPSTSHPFIPGIQLHTADFIPKPLQDIRKYSRAGITVFNLGAYEN